jgi:hypothetical protein
LSPLCQVSSLLGQIVSKIHSLRDSIGFLFLSLGPWNSLSQWSKHSRDTSDHVPCAITIKTEVPKSQIFMFENLWLEHEQFNAIFQQAWNTPTTRTDPAQVLTVKLKSTRKCLKDWQRNLPNLAKTIENTKLVIQFIDRIEEHNDLEIQEWNFRDLLRQHLSNLLEWQKTYWKQRGTVKWVTCGDADTKFFHVNATIRHRQNFITSIEDSTGNLVSRHEYKAQLLWEAYKMRLGTSEFSHMYFDLHNLLSIEDNLDSLEAPFQQEEIERIIQELPADKSPRPDGFNGEFLKRCWPIVKKEFTDLCHAFYDENICLQSINASHIVLVPKKDNPSKIGDFRPISLLNSSVKLLTKILVNSLQKVITRTIHKN